MRLAFLSGGRRVVEGRARTAAAAGIAVRALLIGAIGLLLGYAIDPLEVEVILPYYAVLFLLAIPLLGLRPRTLALAAAALIAVAPVVILAVVDADGPSFRGSDNATFDTLVQDPSGLIVGLLVTGPYPVLAYLAYLCAGLAIGRLDLSSRRLATWLLGGGLALALTARIVSAVLLFPVGGLRHLQSINPSSAAPVTRNACCGIPNRPGRGGISRCPRRTRLHLSTWSARLARRRRYSVPHCSSRGCRSSVVCCGRWPLQEP